MLDNELKNQIVRPLLDWFSQNARILPWRKYPQAYRVWVSEIMLQQTRVEAVKPYFERFMKELPTVEALSICPEDKLLKLWEGLGYYNRVRNMKIAAQEIVAEYQGILPKTREELMKLKGIGSYTAGAIASIAYNQPVPAVDGNVLRIITRVCANSSDIAKQSVKKEIEDDLLTIMPMSESGNFNQAMMELGATVCIPNGAPLCDKCPWNTFCRAHKQDLTAQIPYKTKAKPRTIEYKTVLIIKDNEHIIIRKRPDKGLLAGLYELPNLEGSTDETQLLQYVKQLGLHPIRIQQVDFVKHIFTHKEWHMTGYVVQLEGIEPELYEESDMFFVDQDAINQIYSIPSAFTPYLKYISRKPLM